jgi:hypothetical protein
MCIDLIRQDIGLNPNGGWWQSILVWGIVFGV